MSHETRNILLVHFTRVTAFYTLNIIENAKKSINIYDTLLFAQLFISSSAPQPFLIIPKQSLRHAYVLNSRFSKNINPWLHHTRFSSSRRSLLNKRDTLLYWENEKKRKKSSNPIFMLLLFHFHCLSTNRVKRKWGWNPFERKVWNPKWKKTNCCMAAASSQHNSPPWVYQEYTFNSTRSRDVYVYALNCLACQ